MVGGGVNTGINFKFKAMKKVYTIIAAALTVVAAEAKTYTIGSGKWSDSKIWNGEYIGSTIKADDVVVITGQVTMNVNLTVEGTLQVEKGAAMVGMKDLVVAKGGKFVNNGNTVMKSIVNEGSITNNLIMEAMNDVYNRASISNNNNMVAGNNFQNFGGNASGNNGAYFVNNTIQTSPNAKFGTDVRVFYGNAIENASASSSMSLNATIKNDAVVLSVSNIADINPVLYSIEKSNDGKNFQLVDMVSASNAALNYTDTKINSNLTYYRVKAINGNGTETTLPIATVKMTFNNAFSMAE